MTCKRLIGFHKDTDALSAVEFALIFPVMLMLMLGGIQMVVYINAVRKVELLASTISETISQAIPPNNQTSVATVNYHDLHFTYDAAIVVFPYLMKDATSKGLLWWQDIIIDFASIQFTQTSKTCGTQQDQSTCYTANVVWTSNGTVGNNYRPCSPAQTPTTSNVSSRYTLPTSVYGPGSIIAIDVTFTFTPTFGANIIGPHTISRSVYVQPRYATLIKYDTTAQGNDGIGTECPNY